MTIDRAELSNRPRISASARCGIVSLAEVMSFMGNAVDRFHAETLAMLLREHDRAHVDRRALLDALEAAEARERKLREALVQARGSIATTQRSRLSASMRWSMSAAIEAIDAALAETAP